MKIKTRNGKILVMLCDGSKLSTHNKLSVNACLDGELIDLYLEWRPIYEVQKLTDDQEDRLYVLQKKFERKLDRTYNIKGVGPGEIALAEVDPSRAFFIMWDEEYNKEKIIYLDELNIFDLTNLIKKEEVTV